MKVSEIAFFSEAEIPNELSTSRVTKSQLLRFFEFYRQAIYPPTLTEKRNTLMATLVTVLFLASGESSYI